jgi:hypothetical protein
MTGEEGGTKFRTPEELATRAAEVCGIEADAEAGSGEEEAVADGLDRGSPAMEPEMAEREGGTGDGAWTI